MRKGASRLTLALALVVALVIAGCGGGSKASTCSEYADELREVIASTTSPEAIQDFLTDTEEDVAKLLLAAGNTADGQECANALTEAFVTIADRGFAQIGD